MEISFNSFLKRSSSSRFCIFFFWIFIATSSMHSSLYLCWASSCSCFLLLMASCLVRDSSRARSRSFARVSAFSWISFCLSSFFPICLSRFSSNSWAFWDCTILRRSHNSACDISSSRPWQGCSAASNCLKRATGTFSRARICLMRSFLLSISCSSSRRFRSASASFSPRICSARSARFLASLSSARRAFSLSACVCLTNFCLSTKSFSSSIFFWSISTWNSPRWCSARMLFFFSWNSRASMADSRASCISTMRVCTRFSSSKWSFSFIFSCHRWNSEPSWRSCS
mmetsp:Transcript_21882/g.61176  ORF Transcript_21882/g.61176 Transcript_21882/m.61176 type:complete len:285 (+) Transcript_21882:399-1253(+)